jgi:O-antigen ligase
MVGVGLSLAFLLTSPLQNSVQNVYLTLLFLLVIVISPLNGLLIWLVSHPFTNILVNLEMGKGIPDLSLARACTAVLLLLMLARTAIGQRKTFSITKVELSFFLYVIARGASMTNLLSPSTILQSLFDLWVMPLIIYFLVKNLVVNRQTLHKTLNLLLIIGLYSAVYMLYELNTGNILFVPNDLDHQFYRDSNLRIVRGLYGTTLTYGLLFNWLLPIATYFFLQTTTVRGKIFYGFLIGLMLVGDLFTYKRTTWLALLVSFLVMQWLYPRIRKFFLALVLVFSVVVVLTWGSISQSELYTQRVANQKELTTANGRTERWDEGWDLWLQKPLFGHGFRRFDVLAKEQNVESDYLDILVSSGLVGFVPYMAFFIFVLGDSIKVYRQIGVNKKLFVDRPLMVVFWGLYSTYFVTAISSSGNDGHNIANLVFFSIIAAIVGSQTPLLTRQPSNSRRLSAPLPAKASD